LTSSVHLPLIVILGPTGSGKSDLAFMLAEKLSGEIVNFDSVQVCRGLDIGSAKQPLSVRERIPHHLVDCVNPNQGLTAGAYSRLAHAVLENIRDRCLVPILVGGTGFYLRALLAGLPPAPAGDKVIRERLGALSKRRPAVLHRYLALYDPPSGRRIHPNDHQKLIRAVELVLLSRRPPSATLSLPRQMLHGFTPLKLGLNPHRALLYTHLNHRTVQMFQGGLLEETEALLKSGVSPESKAMQSLGYRQAVDVLRKRISVEAAVVECQTKTRQYAKRQMTWFRKEPGVIWFNGFGHDSEIQLAAWTRAKQFLTESVSCN
jgi:tRNA dimethylallyltransferase